jgi:hypothetical protein
MTTIAISALPVATVINAADVMPIVQSGITKQLTKTLLFTSPALVTPALGTVASGVISACTSTGMVMVTPVIGAATGTSLSLSGFSAVSAAAPTIASATTIAPTTPIVFVSGTAAVVNITAAAPISTGGGTITLIPTGAFTWTAAGNIAVLGTAVVNRALTMTYDTTTTKWYPSYV